VAFQQLLLGWYPNGTVFDSTMYVPTPYRTNSDKISLYKNVVAPSCRICHVAMDQANFETLDPGSFFPLNDIVCGQSLAASAVNPSLSELSYLMPNSRVTFDRFSLSGRKFVAGQPANESNQPAILSKLYNSLSCHLP